MHRPAPAIQFAEPRWEETRLEKHQVKPGNDQTGFQERQKGLGHSTLVVL